MADTNKMKLVQEILNHLKCVACDQLPTRELWLLGGSSLCTHKYCEKCILSTRDKTCIKCTEPGTGNTHNPYIDLVTTELLSNFKQYRDCVKSGDSCKKACVDEYEFKDSVGDKNKTEGKTGISKITSNDKAGKSGGSNSKKGVKTLPAEAPMTAEQLGERKSKRLAAHPNDKTEVAKSEALIVKKERKSLTKTPKVETPQSEKSETPTKPFITKLSSPTLPVLSLVTGMTIPPNDANQDEVKHTRRSLKLGKGTEISHLLPPASLSVESPWSNSGRRDKRRSARSPSVCSNLSSNNDSTKSNATTIDSLTSEKCNAKGETKLHVTCRIGQVDKVKQLLNAGVDINVCDFAGWTPLHEAINSKSTNSFDIVQLLCEAGCNVNTPGLDNDTPLHECVRSGRIRTIKFLLSYGASTTFRNKAGKLPREVTDNETIQKILDEFKGPYIREPDESEIIKAFMKNSVTFFTYAEGGELLVSFKNVLCIGISDKFGRQVTHVIFDRKDVQDGKVPFSLHYLMSILSGAWLLSSEWVEDSVKARKFMDPRKYEIVGCLKDSKLSVDKALAIDVPSRARQNKELGRPGLFDGFNFYLYKTSAYEDLKKKDLCSLITAGHGKVVIREPTPESVDPLDYPIRFHAQKADHKMTITSHVILYDGTNKPNNVYSMEHLKTLRTDWLIESALTFTILNPDDFA